MHRYFLGAGLALLYLFPASAVYGAPRYAVVPDSATALQMAARDPDAVPAGANVAGCTSPTHPYPVVLVNGTFSVMQSAFGALAPHLANAGYCVHTFNYGLIYPGSYFGALGPVPQSAQQLADFVRATLLKTDSTQVDLIGHSQGGLLALYYAKLLHGAPYTHTLVGLSPTTHGTTLNSLSGLAAQYPALGMLMGIGCPACVDQTAGSPVIRQLDAGPIAQPGVRYTIIETRNETIVTPVGSAFIHEPGVTNEYVQDHCPQDTVDHGNLPYDNVVFRLIENALDPQTAQAPDCKVAWPLAAR